MTSDLVVLSLEPWDEVWRRNQHLVAGLLARDPDRRVVFVEPARDPLFEARSRRLPRFGEGLRAGPLERLWLFRPTKWLPRRAGPWGDRLLTASLHRAVRRAGFTDAVWWVNDSSWVDAVPRGARVVVDLTDDWTSAERSTRELTRITRDETAILDRADRVIVCSAELARRHARRAPIIVPNAVDLAAYARPGPRPSDLPHGPCAVYVGTLHEDRLDVELVVATEQMARRAGGHVVLVGPDALAPHSRRLLDTSSAVVLGARERRAVPDYLMHADVLIVPHVVTDFTESLDPIKAYEYAAAGRPVVSTSVPGFAASESVTVSWREDFPAAVVTQLCERRPRVKSGDVPDWAERVADVDRELRSLEG